MKNVKTILASVVFIMLVSVTAFAGNNKDMVIQFVANDLTNDETKKESARELKKVGLNDAMTDKKGTGVVYFFDADSKKLINQVSVAKSNEELAKAMKTAEEKVN
jgi:hypothetical protein